MKQPTGGDEGRPAACRRFEELESELLAGELTGAALAEHEAHTLACGPCRTRVAFFRTLLAELRELPHEAQAERAWNRIERRLDRECERLEGDLAEVLGEWRGVPLDAQPGRVWRRIEQRTRPSRRARESWLGAGVLVSVASALVLLAREGNDAALRVAARALGERWPEFFAKLAASPGSDFFLSGILALFGGLVALASLPLLLSAAGNLTSTNRTPGSALPGRLPRWQPWAGDTT